MRFRASLATIAITGILTILAAYRGISQTTTTPAATTLTMSAVGGPANWSGGYTVFLSTHLAPATVNEGTVTFTVTDSSGNALGKACNPSGALGPNVQPVTNGAVKNGFASTMWLLPSGSAAGTYTVTASYAGTVNYAAATVTSTLTLQDYSALFPQPATPAYDILFCRMPRDASGLTHNAWGEVFNSTLGVEPNTELCIWHHADGSVTTLCPANGNAFAEPYVEFSGQTALVTRFNWVKNSSGTPTRTGSEVFRVDLTTGTLTQLTNGGYEPNRPDAPSYPVYNGQPCPLPDGGFLFCSNRRGYRAAKSFTGPNMLMFRADAKGQNVECINPMDLGSSLHPFITPKGRIVYTTYQCQGKKDLRNWSLWSLSPDGSDWQSVNPAFSGPFAFHEGTTTTSDNIVCNLYYNENDRNFGSLYLWPEVVQGPRFQLISPTNLPQTLPKGPGGLGVSGFRYAPMGMMWLTPFTTGADSPAPFSNLADPNSPRAGKFCHPCGAPNDTVLTTYSPGPCNRYNYPANDAGIYLIDATKVQNSSAAFVKVLNDPAYHEFWPRPILPYSAIYNKPAPDTIAPVANDGTANPNLKPGMPYGVIGTASMIKQEAMASGIFVNNAVTATTPIPNDPFKGDDGPYRAGEGAYGYPNWTQQGSTAGNFDLSQVAAIRIVGLEPTTAPGQGQAQSWGNDGNERETVIAEVPVRAYDANGNVIMDPYGRPDTSWAVKVQADRPFRFDALNKDGMMMFKAQTWHQVRPGEVKINCGGCHAHRQNPDDFSKCKAGAATYNLWDATDTAKLGRPFITTKANDQSGQKWWDDNSLGVKFLQQPGGQAAPEYRAEYFKDIKPILDGKCVSCHQGATPAGGVSFASTSTNSYAFHGDQFYPGVANIPDTYSILAYQRYVSANAQPYNKLINVSNTWPSRYVRQGIASQSLFVWYVFGRRLDGWKNTDLPTESKPGDPTTLPANFTLWNGQQVGGSAAAILPYVDIDYNWVSCPAATLLDDDTKLNVARWVDQGCLIDVSGGAANGGLQDDARPTLCLYGVGKGPNANAITQFIVGASDCESGLAGVPTLTADFTVDSIAPGSPVPLTATGDGRFAYTLQTPITNLAGGNLTVKAQDKAGNRTALVRTFSVAAAPPPPAPTTLIIPAVTAVASATNQTINLSATLAPATVNEGTVTFTILSGQTPLGTAVSSAVQNGAASAGFTLPGGTAAGSYTISAAYADTPGATNFAASTGTGTLTVTAPPPAVTTTAVAAATVTSSTAAQNVTLTATITPATVSEGTVTFTVLSGTALVGAAITSSTVAAGQASVSYPLPAAIAAGSYTITAAYSGTANFAASSGTAMLTVNPPPNPNQATINQLNAVIADLQNQIANLQAAVNALQNPTPLPQATKPAVKTAPKPPPYRGPTGKTTPYRPIPQPKKGKS